MLKNDTVCLTNCFSSDKGKYGLLDSNRMHRDFHRMSSGTPTPTPPRRALLSNVQSAHRNFSKGMSDCLIWEKGDKIVECPGRGLILRTALRFTFASAAGSCVTSTNFFVFRVCVCGSDSQYCDRTHPIPSFPTVRHFLPAHVNN